MASPDDRFVEIFRLIKAYPNPYGEPAVVVDGFNLIMRRGEVVSVIGHSGCGKSTVLTMVAGLNSITQGSVAIAGREVEGAGPDRAVVFQSPCLLPWMTAYQNVLLGVKQVYPHGSKQQRREICEHYLAEVGLADAMHRYPREMSGGMQQRVGIARAIALKPQMLLLDEPFGRLDSLTRMELQDVILRILDRERITTLVITHDVDEALYMSDRVCMMTTGPRAKVGQMLDLPFARPRDRKEVLEHFLYYELRGCLVSFLEQQDKRTFKTVAVPSGTDHTIEAMSETRSDFRAWRHEASDLIAGAADAASTATVELMAGKN
ncbi:MAG: bacitracin ABC transporter ATP-binding protein [Planctomycetaceae bacterium]|nr:bacitracin ABC transporter ATP-binding protein [Planctomycetaceae bacterium]